MGNPQTYHFKLPPYQGAPLPEPPHSWYPNIQSISSRITSERTGRSDGRVRAFVVHATAGSSSAGAASVMFEGRASFHWLIPDEDETAQHGRSIWACAPESRAAWHVRNDRSHPDVNHGSRNVNYWSLGVELVNVQRNDPFSAWQMGQAAALVRYAWSKYPDLVDVVSHAKLDPNRRNDPGDAFDWERFRELVLTPPMPLFAPLHLSAPAQPMLDAVLAPLTILSPRGERIECDARLSDGVTVVEARPLIEALGFRVEYDDQVPMTMQIRAGSNGATNRTAAASSKKTSNKKTAKDPDAKSGAKRTARSASRRSAK